MLKTPPNPDDPLFRHPSLRAARCIVLCSVSCCILFMYDYDLLLLLSYYHYLIIMVYLSLLSFVGLLISYYHDYACTLFSTPNRATPNSGRPTSGHCSRASPAL